MIELKTHAEFVDAVVKQHNRKVDTIVGAIPYFVDDDDILLIEKGSVLDCIMETEVQIKGKTIGVVKTTIIVEQEDIYNAKTERIRGGKL